MTTTTREEVAERYRNGLISGQRFLWAYESHASADRMSPRGPIGSRTYSQIVTTVGRFAMNGPRAAATAHRILAALPLYGTPGQTMAAVARALSEVVQDGYYDVIGATGPEAGRPSDHKHATTIYDAIILDLLWTEIGMTVGASVTGSVTGIGWCLDALIREHNVPVTMLLLPNVAAYWTAKP
jgi:hypothetical protein